MAEQKNGGKKKETKRQQFLGDTVQLLYQASKQDLHLEFSIT